MYMWVSPVPRGERSIPLSPIQPYSRITPYLNRDRNPEPEAEQYPIYPDLREEPSVVEPAMTMIVTMTQFARSAALLVQAAQDVADQAAKLRTLSTLTLNDLESFMASVNRMTEQNEWKHASLLVLAEPQEDTAYLRSDQETIEYWECKAHAILEFSPLELMTDMEPFQAFATYNENKQKTWRFPSQGWLMQAYG